MRLFVQAATCAFRFLRQPSRPKPPRAGGEEREHGVTRSETHKIVLGVDRETWAESPFHADTGGPPDMRLRRVS
jgi:hypothetical protein